MRFPKTILSVLGVASAVLLATSLPGPEAGGSKGLGSSSAMSSASTQRPRGAAAPQRKPEGPWGQPVGSDPCGSEKYLEDRLADDPSLASHRDVLESLVQEAQRKGLLPSDEEAQLLSGPPIYIIPVAVHIVHLSGPENISDMQVLSQLDALNRDCQNLPGNGSPATDTQIKFCLAQNLPPSSSVTWSTTPGITRTNSPETNHIFGNATSEAALKAIDYLPSDRYLNIWVVKNISGGSGGVVGYATFPGTVPPTLDGIVMSYRVFGSNTTGYGTFPSLLPSNNDGKVLTHEVGHYLNLFHTFHLGCTSPGDQVSDTPPEAVNNTGCPSPAPLSCTASPDPIENFMDYTNDTCRFAFTAGQTVRMHAVIGVYRSLLVSAGNLIFTGCSSGLNALISATPGQVCPNGTIQFSTPASGTGYTYAWTFSGGTPPAANTQSASSQFSTVGPHTVTLTVTDGSGNFSTNTITIYVVNCTPIAGACTNWVFSKFSQLDFSSGLPAAVNGTQNQGFEAAAAISDSAGNLLFYSDADKVWDRNNSVMPNGTGIFGGTSSHNGAIIAPRPGSSTQYFLFTISQQENGPVPNPVRVTTIDMTLNGGNGDVVVTEKNLPVTLPGNPTFMLEGQTLIPHCNGVDWWYITHQWGQGANNKLYVTLVTSGLPNTWTSNAYSIGIGYPGVQALGAITASRDGSKLAVVQWESGQIRVYNFNRTTGVPALSLTGPPAGGAYSDVAFSPNGTVLYYSYFSGSAYGFRQWDLATSQMRVLSTSGLERDVELGPDGKVYVSMAGQNTLGCVNFPDNFNTLNANECGYNPSSIPLGAGTSSPFAALPNTLQLCSATQPAQFTYTVTNCLTVQFHAVNCSGPYTWNFGDSSTGSGQNVTHTYSGQGTYNVTLTVSGASPPTVTIPVTLMAASVTIAGPLNTCTKPANYSVNGPSNYTYQWTVTGGSPTTATGNNVDVMWGASGGTVTVVATDPNTGCTSTATLTVAPCPCIPAPPDLAHWWPFDDAPHPTIPTMTAHDIAGGRDGDIKPGPLNGGGPTSVPGIVGNAFEFNGSTTFVEVPDGPGTLSFGNPTDSFSIDAWVNVKSADKSGVRPIVDKRLQIPNAPLRGYTFFLVNGQLGFQLADDVAGTSLSCDAGPPFTANCTNYVSAVDVADGNWHLVAVTVQRPGNVTLTVDGVVVLTRGARTGNANQSAALLIGTGHPIVTSQPYFKGAIDELEIFNRALSQSEIQAIFNAGSAGKCKAEICVSKFNDLNGNGVQDPNEPPLFGWKFDIKDSQGNIIGTVTTDKEKPACRLVPAPGTYTVTEQVQSGWVPTTPNPQTVTVQPGQTVNLQFGNTRAGMAEICVFKFEDKDGDGVQDTGEPGLPGWTITITDPSGNIVVTVTTGPQGSFCVGVPAPATYTVAEVLPSPPPTWMPTVPPGGVYNNVTVSSGQLVNLIFGNKQVGGCVTPPTGMVGWWPLDELTGPTSLDISGLLNHGTWVGNPMPTPGKVAGALSLGLPGLDYVRVPDPSNNSLDFGTNGDFSIDAWINTTFVFGDIPIVGKLSGSPVRGYAFVLGQSGPLGLYMAGTAGLQGYAAVNFTGNLHDGQWHHVAVTVDRNLTTGGTFYVDGNPVDTFNPTLTLGSISNATDLHIGNMFVLNTNMNWVGLLDEIEIFNRALTAAEVQAIFSAGSAGKCKPPIIALPDFVVRDLVVTGPQGEGNFIATFRIVNEGNAAVDRRVNHEVRLISEGGDPNGTVLDTVTTNALAVGASQRFIVPFRITPSGAIVDHVVRVIADSDRRIQELSETNNVGQSATFRF